MSLEETIAANTAAVVALTAALNKPLWLDPSLAKGLPLTAGSPTSTAQTIGKVAGDVAAAVVASTPAAALAGDAQAVVTVTVTDVLNAATQLIAKTDKATLAATLKEINAKSIAAIAPDSLKPALDKINAAIAAAA